jgi:hypothetical protein
MGDFTMLFLVWKECRGKSEKKSDRGILLLKLSAIGVLSTATEVRSRSGHNVVEAVLTAVRFP